MAHRIRRYATSLPQLAHDDRRVVRVGEWLDTPAGYPVHVGASGLHYCNTLLNALKLGFSPYSWRTSYICRVKVQERGDSAEVFASDGVYVARRRMVVEMKEATPLLSYIANNVDELLGFKPDVDPLGTERYYYDFVKYHANTVIRHYAGLDPAILPIHSTRTVVTYMKDVAACHFGYDDHGKRYFEWVAAFNDCLTRFYKEMPDAKFD